MTLARWPAVAVLALGCSTFCDVAAASATAPTDSSGLPSSGAGRASYSAGMDSASASERAVPPSDSLIRALDTDPRGFFGTVPPEPVYLGGTVLLEIRDPLGYPTAKARAEVIRTRLRAVSRSDLPLDSIRSEPTAVGARILAGSATVAQITWDDLPPGETRAPADVARDLLPRLRERIAHERRLFEPIRLATSSILTAALALAYLALAWVLGTRGRHLARMAGAKAAQIFGPIRIGDMTLLHRRVVAAAAYRATLLLLTFAVLLTGYALLSYAFSLFPWTQGWGARLGSFAFGLVRRALSAVLSALPGLLLAALVLLGFRMLIRGVSRLLDRVSARRLVIPGLHPELAKPTKQLVRVLLWIAAIVIVYPLIPGSESPAFKGVSILLGVVVSFGSTGLVENLLAGLVLTYARSYRLGERIGTGEILGDVTSMGLLTTKVLTIKNEVVTLGNAQILRGSVKNYSRQTSDGPGVILHTSVTIGYDTPWRTVHALLIEAADATEGFERTPRPFVLQRSLRDFYIEYEINAYTRRANEMVVLYGRLHQNIQDAFRRAGVEIMSPHYRSIRDGNPSTVPSEGSNPLAT